MILDNIKTRCVFTCGTFDLLHAGHVLMLQEAASVGDHLIVGLQTDPTVDRPEKNQPVESVTERFIKLTSLRYVDEVIPYTTEQDLTNLIKSIKIDVRVVGADYLDRDFTGKQWCVDNGIDIYYNRRSHQYSSTNMRVRVSTAENIKNYK